MRYLSFMCGIFLWGLGVAAFALPGDLFVLGVRAYGVDSQKTYSLPGYLDILEFDSKRKKLGTLYVHVRDNESKETKLVLVFDGYGRNLLFDWLKEEAFYRYFIDQKLSTSFNAHPGSMMVYTVVDGESRCHSQSWVEFELLDERSIKIKLSQLEGRDVKAGGEACRVFEEDLYLEGEDFQIFIKSMDKEVLLISGEASKKKRLGLS